MSQEQIFNLLSSESKSIEFSIEDIETLECSGSVDLSKYFLDAIGVVILESSRFNLIINEETIIPNDSMIIVGVGVSIRVSPIDLTRKSVRILSLNYSNSKELQRINGECCCYQPINILPYIEKFNVIQSNNSTNVNDLSFGYTNDVVVINNITFKFEKGKKYLILGESGCGKSTLLKILAGFYDLNSVYIDNDPTTANTPKHILMVGQQPYLFSKSIRNNIDLLETANDKELTDAIKKCVLIDYISSLPDGVETIVDEEVNRTSGGQKARIGLARALYNKPEILLIDEITSSLDNETAHKVEKMLLSLNDVLIIHVSHKPYDDLISLYDEVITMKNGRIVKTN